MVWNVTWSDAARGYVKAQGGPYTLSWAAQYQVELHQPESWGYLQFDARDGECNWGGRLLGWGGLVLRYE